MKKIYLILILEILLIGSVFAGIGVGSIIKERSIEKEQRDILLSKTDLGEINPDVKIRCSNDYCLWSAIQENIISSDNNKFQRYWINQTHNITTGELISEERIELTDDEIKDLVANVVLNKLERFADTEISREVYEDWGIGNIKIVEKEEV